jgi:hypothetical protein
MMGHALNPRRLAMVALVKQNKISKNLTQGVAGLFFAGPL